MTPFFFGADARPLFGVLHRARRSASARSAALLCYPWGDEAELAHRFYRVLAERLADEGLDVLRFDYYGTGDSGGEDVEGDLDGWAADIATAHETLLERSEPARVAWLGARLGAAVAAQASARVRRPPDRLVLWDPVTDGSRYLTELAERHASALDLSYAVAHYDWRSAARADTRECLGFEIGDRLHHELRALTPERVRAPRTWHCDIAATGDASDAAALAERWRGEGLRVESVAPACPFDWTSPEAHDAALVPEEHVRLLLARLRA